MKFACQRHICTAMLIAGQFTTVKKWKQPKCPSTDELKKKMWYIYTKEFYSAMKIVKSYHLQQHG
jgi:hypothetical protein